ncbi:unnamed protein product [Blepharisma stoltei]|uniref:Uncharacterized protein n=1 Tax=Blepharisma stoltei TaxID=1481888 RepID=A0AAU9K4A8_9CILI|nr:unnamed protein product [Blepharisma stoltei]
MKEILLKSRSKLIKDSIEIIGVTKNTLNKALEKITKLEESFNSLITETEREEFYDLASENDIKSLFKLNPFDAKIKLKNWCLSTLNTVSWNNIAEKVKEMINLSAPYLTQEFSGQNIDSTFKIPKPISENQPPPSLFRSLEPANSQSLFQSNSQDLFKPNSQSFQPNRQGLFQFHIKGLFQADREESFQSSQSTLHNPDSVSYENIQKRGTKLIKYCPLSSRDDSGSIIYIRSINASSEFNHKSVEELRFEDYQFNIPLDSILKIYKSNLN